LVFLRYSRWMYFIPIGHGHSIYNIYHVTLQDWSVIYFTSHNFFLHLFIFFSYN
jgi:hypothetical protein